MEKFLQSLKKAEESIKVADHMIYITYKIVQEKRLLVKIFEQIYLTIENIINSILEYEHLYKRVRFYPKIKDKLKVLKKLSSKYSITEKELKIMERIIDIGKKHKESEIEFATKEKFMIMSNTIESLTLVDIKEYIKIAKQLLMKIHDIMDKDPLMKDHFSKNF